MYFQELRSLVVEEASSEVATFEATWCFVAFSGRGLLLIRWLTIRGAFSIQQRWVWARVWVASLDCLSSWWSWFWAPAKIQRKVWSYTMSDLIGVVSLSSVRVALENAIRATTRGLRWALFAYAFSIAWRGLWKAYMNQGLMCFAMWSRVELL